MEHVHNFRKVKSPKVPKFKPSPPAPPAEPVTDQNKDGITEDATLKTAEKTETTTVAAEMRKEPEGSREQPISESDPTKTEPKVPDIQADPTYDDNIMSETGTNFDESIFYDQSTIDKIEEDKFYYKFDDWENPASSSPVVKGTLDYKAQKYFDELEGVDTTLQNLLIKAEQAEKNIVEEATIESEPIDETKIESELKQNGEYEFPNNAQERVHKEETEIKNSKIKGKTEKCDCEKVRKQMKKRKDTRYNGEEEENWEKDIFKGKNSESEFCDCKWRLLP